MKIFLGIITCLLSTLIIAQRTYWQQAVDYKMEIDMDVKSYQYQGKMEVKYDNNSPDVLNKIYFHLYFNAFQPGSLMDLRLQNIVDPDGRMVNNIGTKETPKYESRIAKLKPDEIGYQKIKSIKQNGENVDFETDGTLLVVDLKNDIQPNTSTVFTLEWEAQVPQQIRRSGRNNAEGVSLSMTQWYPKIAEYDFQGWHLDEYIAREFHAPFGNFDVKINIDKDYIIGSSGKLQNPKGVKGYDKDASPKAKNGKSEWHFKVENIHDFAWAADPDFKVETTIVPNGPQLYFVYHETPTNKDAWQQVKQPTVDFFEFMSANFGQYPWETYTIVQGGDGGMEYGTVTLITGERPFASLKGVIWHEAAHSWFQQLFGFNETVHEWMDEGFTSYADATLEHQYSNSQNINPYKGAYDGYVFLVKQDIQEPLASHADYYESNTAYSINAYYKGQLTPPNLGYIIGDENLKKTFYKFYEDWRFKHPTPNDFKRVAEKVSGINLKWFFINWVETTRTMDYAVESVNENEIQLRNLGNFPMPIDVLVEYTNGSKELFYIPLHAMRGNKKQESIAPYKGIKRTILNDWGWTNPVYKFNVNTTVKSVTIDPTERMSDVDLSNNSYPKY